MADVHTKGAVGASGGDSTDGRTRPWWAADDGELPCPMWTPVPVGAPGSWKSAVATAVILVVLVATRWAVFPASIWDQDEAYLSLAVVDFNPTENQPHPPWFPGWVVAGRAVSSLFDDPADGLRALSAAASVWTLFPLTALFAIWMARRLATASAFLYLCLPGPWWLSGRAFSDTPATFLLLLAAAWWLRPAATRTALLGGSLAAGACVLVRPQFLPPILALAVWRFLKTSARRRFLVLAPMLGLLLAGAVFLVVASGGFATLASAIDDHAGFQLAGARGVEFDPSGSALARALIAPGLAMLWLILAAMGFGVWMHSRRAVGSPLPLVVAVIVPLAAEFFVTMNPHLTRYALPLMALTVGPVVLGGTVGLGRGTWVVVAATGVAVIALGWPQAMAYRAAISPPIAALEEGDEWAADTGGELIVQRSLLSFAEYQERNGRLETTVISDFSVEIGASHPEGPVVVVGLRQWPRVLASVTARHDVRCDLPWVRRLEGDRFMDIRVEAGSGALFSESRW